MHKWSGALPLSNRALRPHYTRSNSTPLNHQLLEQNPELKRRWDLTGNPGGEHTETALAVLLRQRTGRKVLNCAIPLTRAKSLTDFELPEGVKIEDCIVTSATGNFPDALAGWSYTPKIRAEAQLPYMVPLPPEHASLVRVPWFQSPSQATWLGINARHLRYHHQLWQDLHPKVLRGLHTTLVTVTPQIGFALTPHIQLEKSFMFLGSLARGLLPVQLFPGRYIYPDANLGELADAPAPIFADILPATGGFNFPSVDCDPDPWRVLARFENGDRYYGYPFTRAIDSDLDFTLTDHELGYMLLPDGSKVRARHSKSYVYATLDPKLREELQMNRDEFEEATGLVRGAVTHDGLPFQLPIEMQPMVFAIMLTQWQMELDRPGDLTSYTLSTQHAAIRGFHYYQRVEPYYTNFMRFITELAKDPSFRTYPLASHLTHSWLGGNLRLANQLSKSETKIGPELMRSYYHQQLDWQAGVINLMNHVGFRTKSERGALVSQTGREIEHQLSLDGLAFHQMNRLLRFDSHLFQRPGWRVSYWPNFHSGWSDLDRKVLTESLPKI